MSRDPLVKSQTAITSPARPGNHAVLRGRPRLSDREFQEIRCVIRKKTGIAMNDSKHELVQRRLCKRLKVLGLHSFREYFDRLESGDEAEMERFCNAVTTNLTSFFRENHHFDFLAREILPALERDQNRLRGRLRIWSAGCSTGEEAYSIAMTMRGSMRGLDAWDAKILATDLDSDVLQACRRGVYSEQRLETVPAQLLKKWFRRVPSAEDGEMSVASELRDLIAFKQLNLINAWPMRGKFDVIFCRNVIIYFDKDTQRTLMDRFADILADDGYLIIGHSESLFNVSARFSLVGNTIYRKAS